jgi:hypothetical protein
MTYLRLRNAPSETPWSPLVLKLRRQEVELNSTFLEQLLGAEAAALLVPSHQK